MQCPHCGADVSAGSTFCPRCRKRVTLPSAGFAQGANAPAPPVRGEPVARPVPQPVATPPAIPSVRPSGLTYGAPARFERPTWVSALAIVAFLSAGLVVVAAVVFAVGVFGAAGPRPSGTSAVGAAMLLLYGAIGALYFFNGLGLWTLRRYGWILQVIMAILNLCGFPFATALSIMTFIYLFRPGTRILFSGRSPADLGPEEQAEVERASRGGTLFVILLAVLLVATILMAAAIAIPSLLRSRIAGNEAAAALSLRAIVSAQSGYAAYNGHLYDGLDCLMEPTRCMPQGRVTEPPLDRRFAETVRRGYEFRFYPGPKPEPGTFDPARVSPTSVTSFAVTAVPIRPNRTGVRSFCADHTGRICVMDVVIEGELEAGACPQGCRDSAY